MLLVDTSVWVNHLRDGNARLEAILEKGGVVCHPFIIGEIACGNLKNRMEILGLFKKLPSAVQARHNEVLNFIEEHQLMAAGLGYIDVHLLASAMLTGARIWTMDKKLVEASHRLGLALD